MKQKSQTTKPVVELAHSFYQPSKAELEEDVSINASFQELTRAVVQDVTIKYTPKSRKHKKK